MSDESSPEAKLFWSDCAGLPFLSEGTRLWVDVEPAGCVIRLAFEDAALWSNKKDLAFEMVDGSVLLFRFAAVFKNRAVFELDSVLAGRSVMLGRSVCWLGGTAPTGSRSEDVA